MPAQPVTDTRTRLLDAGEELFAAKGFAAVSLRDLTARADANLAAVSYHFHDKAELFREVVRRRAGGLNGERLRLLESAGAAPTVEALIDAFVRPAVVMASDCDRGKSGFCRLLGRMLLEEPELASPLVREVFKPVFERFLHAFQTVCPELDPASLWWRVHCLAGATLHTLMHQKDLAVWSGGLVTGEKPDAMVAEIVASQAPGFRSFQPVSPTPQPPSVRADRAARPRPGARITKGSR